MTSISRREAMVWMSFSEQLPWQKQYLSKGNDVRDLEPHVEDAWGQD